MPLRLDRIYHYIVIKYFEIKENGIDYEQWFYTGHIMTLICLKQRYQSYILRYFTINIHILNEFRINAHRQNVRLGIFYVFLNFTENLYCLIEQDLE